MNDSLKKDFCEFCDVIKKADRFLLETAHFVLIENIYPYENDHVLVLSKKHLHSELDMSQLEQKDLMKIHLKTIEIFYREKGGCLSFTRENTQDQSMWHYHRHYLPTDLVLRNGIKRSKHNPLSFTFESSN